MITKGGKLLLNSIRIFICTPKHSAATATAGILLEKIAQRLRSAW